MLGKEFSQRRIQRGLTMPRQPRHLERRNETRGVGPRRRPERGPFLGPFGEGFLGLGTHVDREILDLGGGTRFAWRDSKEHQPKALCDSSRRRRNMRPRISSSKWPGRGVVVMLA